MGNHDKCIEITGTVTRIYTRDAKTNLGILKEIHAKCMNLQVINNTLTATRDSCDAFRGVITYFLNDSLFGLNHPTKGVKL